MQEEVASGTTPTKPPRGGKASVTPTITDADFACRLAKFGFDTTGVSMEFESRKVSRAQPRPSAVGAVRRRLQPPNPACTGSPHPILRSQEFIIACVTRDCHVEVDDLAAMPEYAKKLASATAVGAFFDRSQQFIDCSHRIVDHSHQIWTAVHMSCDPTFDRSQLESRNH